MKILLTTTRDWHLGRTAAAFAERNALAGLWMADKNRTGVPAELYRRAWPYHLAMKPFYHLTPQIWNERATYRLVGLYDSWLRSKLRAPDAPKFDAVHALLGFGIEAFARADKVGALKIADCPNSHPVTQRGYWQRECDLWFPGERVPIPDSMFARMNRELESADVVLCPSDFVQDTMIKCGVPAEKCFINPFGVDTSVFQARASVPATPKFISVGTICLRKGHQYLFPAFKEVRRQLPQAELICVGGFKTDFRRERPKWEGTFRHIPMLPHAELAKLLQECTAFVLTSIEEGLARVIPEAMAGGLPIIATRETGAGTLVRDGVEGFVVPQRNPAAIAEVMLRLAKDPNLCRKMGEAARVRGAVKNTWLDYGDRLLAEYERRRNRRMTQKTI